MRRKLFTLAAGVSAVLWVAVSRLWVAGCFSGGFRWPSESRSLRIWTETGEVFVYAGAIRFGIYRDDLLMGRNTEAIWAGPSPLVVAALSVLPLAWLIQRRPPNIGLPIVDARDYRRPERRA